MRRLALALVLLLALAGHCFADPGLLSRPDSPGRGEVRSLPRVSPSIQSLSDQTVDWLASTLHAEVDHRPVVVTNLLSSDEADGQYDPATDSTVIRPAIALYAVVGDPEALAILAHEELHRRATEACWGHDEEGIVQALMEDLFPALSRHFLGRRASPGASGYDGPGLPVSDVRRAIEARTYHDSWGPDERRYLRRVWAASCEGRADLLGAP